MSDMQGLFFSYTGKPQNRQSAGEYDMPPDQVRRCAISLYVSLRQQQEESGDEPIAVVWIDSRQLEPTAAELDEYHCRIAAILAREQEWRVAHADDPMDEDADESPSHEEVRAVELAEADFVAAAQVDEAFDVPEEPPLVDLIGLDVGFDSGSDLEI